MQQFCCRLRRWLQLTLAQLARLRLNCRRSASLSCFWCSASIACLGCIAQNSSSSARTKKRDVAWPLVFHRISLAFSLLMFLHVAYVCMHCGLLLRTAHYGPRSFAMAGPAAWNSLPASLHDKQLSVTSFRRLLRTHLFRRAYVGTP